MVAFSLPYRGTVLGVASVGELHPVDVAHGAPSLGRALLLAGRPVDRFEAAGGDRGCEEEGEEHAGDERLHHDLTVGALRVRVVRGN